jgi:hypothetical protein
MGAGVSPQFAVRLDYRFKKIHGPFAGIATNRSVLAYQFTDPETGATNFTASRGDMQFRLEAGYQVRTKPLGKKPGSLRIQPFAGMAFVPNTMTALVTDNSSYRYNAGNWSSALIAGTNFEVGKMVVGVQYLKGLGNLSNETLVSETKAVTTQLRSSVSAWNVTVGVPVSLAKKKKAPEVKKKSCSSYYRTRCGNWQ